MAHRDFTGLIRRANSDKMVRDKTVNIVKNPKYDVYPRDPASMV